MKIRILNNEYFKNILTMFSGIFISQLILFFGSIILTRIFSPEDFGIAAFFFSISNILVVISTLRYEQSIILPPSDADSYNLMNLSMRFVMIFSLLILISILIFNDFIVSFIQKPLLKNWFYFLPIIIILNAFFFIYRNWLVRIRNFGTISKGAILKSITINVCLILGGLIYNSPIIFLFANIFSQFIETIYFFYFVKNDTNKKLINKNQYFRSDSINLLKKYIDFPKYSLPSDILNNYTRQNPILLLSTYFGDSTVGFFSLTQRVIGLPIKLISRSTSEVYKQKATEDYNKNGNCINIFFSTLKYLFLIAVFPTSIFLFFGPNLFRIFFGEEWYISGIFSQYLMLMFLFQFCVSPLSFTLYIAGKQNYNLYWQILLLVFTSIGIFYGIYNNSYHLSILGYSIAYSVMYIIYLFLIYLSAKGKL